MLAHLRFQNKGTLIIEAPLLPSTHAAPRAPLAILHPSLRSFSVRRSPPYSHASCAPSLESRGRRPRDAAVAPSCGDACNRVPLLTTYIYTYIYIYTCIYFYVPNILATNTGNSRGMRAKTARNALALPISARGNQHKCIAIFFFFYFDSNQLFTIS